MPASVRSMLVLSTRKWKIEFISLLRYILMTSRVTVRTYVQVTDVRDLLRFEYITRFSRLQTMKEAE